MARSGLALGVLAVVACTELSAEEPAAFERLPGPVGTLRIDVTTSEDTLLDVAFRNRVGFEATARLNPGVDVWMPAPGTIVRLPTEVLPPRADPEGLVLNVPEMRLFDFTVENGPEIFAVAVGDADDPTIVGEFRIGPKRVDPAWVVPDSIHRDRPELPSVVPPGSGNPLGSRFMRIGQTSYGIHGTNNRWSIGREATHGCVRMYEDQVKLLFDRIPEGTRLQIVYQPYKWGRDGRYLLFEASPDIYGRIGDRLATALAPMREMGLLDRVDVERVWQAIEEAVGIPVIVGTLPPTEPGAG